MPLLGAHVSVAGGLHLAFERGAELGCRSLQIFVKNASRWQAKPLEEATVTTFRATWQESAIGPVVAHAAYLINLASPKTEVRDRSISALADELTRCHRLGLDGLVFHPGAHLGEGEEAGLAAILDGVEQVLQRVPDGPCRLLFETTAGQGTVLGYRLEQIETLLTGASKPDAVGVCLDTCHLLAAGYPIAEPAGMGDLLDEALERFGERLACVHINDSKHPQGSRKDRHCNVGEGFVGSEALVALVHDERLSGIPLILETPAGEADQGHLQDLAVLEQRIPGPGRSQGLE